MFKKHLYINQILFVIAVFAAFGTQSTSAQTTVFTYQGKLTDTGTPQAIYQMQFKMFGSPGGADQIGSEVTNTNVSVTQGVFTVQLDFGASAFPGADRFLEIAVRRSSSDSFVTLNPRQQITSSSYSIRTLSAAQADIALDSNKLGGVDASEYVTTTSVGSSFVKNATALQVANFNINGNGFIGGNVGIGTSVPTSKLQVVASGYGFTQTSGAVTVGSFISTSGGGSGWFGTRTNHPLNFFTNDSSPQMTLSTTGNVGIGVTNPTARLDVFSPPGTSGIYSESSSGRAVWGKSMTSRGVYGESNTLEGVFGVSNLGTGVSGNSTSSIGVYGESQSLLGTGVYARNLSGGRAFFAEGNVTQTLSSGGLVKAMIYVDPNGGISRCYNALTNSSTGGCGFIVTRTDAGKYAINFGFQIDNRFVVGNAFDNPATFCLGSLLYVLSVSGNNANVVTNCSVNEDASFTLLVY